MGVDVTAIGDLLDLREDVVEVLRPLEEPEAAGVHVREVQDRQDALCVLHERQDFVQAADDLRASARLDPRREWIFAFLYASRTVRRFLAIRFRASFGSGSPNMPRCVITIGARIASATMR